MFGLSNKPKKIEGDIGYFHLGDGRITLNDYDEYVKDLKARQEQLDDQLVKFDPQ